MDYKYFDVRGTYIETWRLDFGLQNLDKMSLMQFLLGIRNIRIFYRKILAWNCRIIFEISWSENELKFLLEIEMEYCEYFNGEFLFRLRLDLGLQNFRDLAIRWAKVRFLLGINPTWSDKRMVRRGKIIPDVQHIQLSITPRMKHVRKSFVAVYAR